MPMVAINNNNNNLLFFFLFFFYIPVIFSSSKLDPQYDECGSPRLSLGCGLMNPTNFSELIAYPFWGGELEIPPYCGQSHEFQIFCKDHEIPTMEIFGFTFRVVSVNLETHTIIVAEESIFEGRCPNTLYLNGNYTPYSLDNTNSDTIDIYECSSSSNQQLSSSSLSYISCKPRSQHEDQQQLTYHVFDPSVVPINFCTSRGENIPMLRSVKDRLYNRNLTLEQALKKGFGLMYFQHKFCLNCTRSGGICGSNPSTGDFRCLCQDKPHKLSCHITDQKQAGGIRISHKKILAIGISCGILGHIVFSGGIIIIIYKVLSSRKQKTQRFNRPSNLDLDAILPLKQYSYRELKKITSSFTRIVGKGGFGTVYQGQLVDGHQVAVKILKNLDSDGEDFINEVISISQTSHINIVGLLGFCYQGSNRALVYEYVENGTLQQFISGNNSLNRDMPTLYRIALGIAKGLQYLHYGCKTRIVHFDIKPQNVLLDHNLCPKISDFGLAKICERRESIMSSINTRGTIGYIAPEICSRMYGEVTHKADVYSYGMLLIDMIGAKKKAREADAASSSSTPNFFPDWMHESIMNGEYEKILGNNEIREEEEDVGKKMVLVGLWCIQTQPAHRPSMEEVVEMMEGSLDSIQIPPKVSFQTPTSSHLQSSQDHSDFTFASRGTSSSFFP